MRAANTPVSSWLMRTEVDFFVFGMCGRRTEREEGYTEKKTVQKDSLVLMTNKNRRQNFFQPQPVWPVALSHTLHNYQNVSRGVVLESVEHSYFIHE